MTLETVSIQHYQSHTSTTPMAKLAKLPFLLTNREFIEREVWVQEPQNTLIPVDEQGRCVCSCTGNGAKRSQNQLSVEMEVHFRVQTSDAEEKQHMMT